MRFDDVAIPMGAAWSSPFARWQGDLAEIDSLYLAADVTDRALKTRSIDSGEISGIVLGSTVPEIESFYGAPTLAARLGLADLTGPAVNQACATSAACLAVAGSATLAGEGSQLVITTDRTSNGPTLSWPRPSAAGGAPHHLNWVVDNFDHDPWAGASMLAAGEKVASKHGVTRAELDELVALRWQQYQNALAGNRDFQRRYMVPVQVPRRKRDPLTIDSDRGVRSKALDDIGGLPTAAPDGLHSYAAQTHPADGTAGAVVTTVADARRLSNGRGVVEILATAVARVAPSHMPEAPVPAAMKALSEAGLTIRDVAAVTSHNPFAVNDIVFSRQTGFPLQRMNSFGCSLVYGHPQGPTGLRAVVELAEELHQRGGGIGLFTGCAAGDTGAAVVIRVGD